MEKNALINAWKMGAEAIKKGYEKFGKDPKEKLMTLAREQMEMIADKRPNKSKTTQEQMNEMQLEMWNYLDKVARTGEL